MAIQMRRGSYDDFDASKMLPGELAVVVSDDTTTNSGKSVRVCFSPGDVQKFVTDVEMNTAVANAMEEGYQIYLEELIGDVTTAKNAANTAAGAANTAATDANAAKNSANSAASAANEAATLANAAAAQITKLWVDMGTISSLPVTKNVTGATADMICVKAELGTPMAQIDDWTVTTANNSVTISGSISGSTTLQILLEEVSDITAT